MLPRLVLQLAAASALTHAASALTHAAAPCDLSGSWVGDAAVTVATSAPSGDGVIPFVASAAGAWSNVRGSYTPSNASLTFACCGGIAGTINSDCNVITWRDGNKDVWRRGQPPRSAVLSSPLLSVGLGVTASGSANIDTFSFFGAGANTTNFALAAGDSRGGGTTLVPGGLAGTSRGALSAQCGAGCSLAASPTLATLSNLTLTADGGVELAVETWTLTLVNATAFDWTIVRTWTGAGLALGVDRVALSFETTGGLPIHSQQIPSFVDLDVFVNATTTGGFDLGNGAFEFLSPHARQFVRFTPTGAVFSVEGTASVQHSGGGEDSVPLFFSFAKPFADGTAWCSVGFEAIDPRGAPRPPPSAGTVQRMRVTFSLVEHDIPPPGVASVGPFPTLSVALANATLTAQMNVLFSSQYQLLGSFMGNNPASVPCLHEMAWWPLMASTLDAGSIAFAAMQRELSFFTECGWNVDGADGGVYEYVHSCNLTDGARFGLTHRYASSGFYNAPWGPLQDENVMLPIAVYYAAASSGDKAWLASMRPALDTIAAYLASRGLTLPTPPGGVVFVSPASGLADAGRHASNWYDVINFGHLDAYIAVHGVWAMECLSEIYAALGDADAAAHAAAIHAQAAKDFNSIFWNASRRAYTDWIDVHGNARSYFYVDIAFVAIIAGVADAAQATALLDHYDERLAEIYSAYNVTPGSIWSAPCNLYPVTDACEIANSGSGTCPRGGVEFPSYENGGAFFHSPGLQFAAMGVAGRADDAFEGFSQLMNSGFGEIRGWAQQLYWGHNGAPGSLVGGDPLNTAALSVWGFLRGTFGVAASLAHGLVVVNAPAAASEGAVWNTSVLGESVCVTVRGARALYCNGSVISSG